MYLSNTVIQSNYIFFNMKRLLFIYLHLLITLIMVSCNSESPSTIESDVINPSEAYEELNIVYGNNDNQVFDLYLPANRTAETKTIILVHGGGWTSGDKANMTNIQLYIKDQMPDYAIVNMNYRLATESMPPYPMQINDITSVVNYLTTNQTHYTISENFGFIGVSAGAHLSLLWSYAFDTANQVDMVASIVGPTNFTDPAYLESDNSILQQFIASLGIDNSIAFLEEISPYHRVTSSVPPTILFYGGDDPLIPISQGTAMRTQLEEHHVIHEYTLYPDEGHGWEGLNLLDTTQKLQTFIETHL